ncbi:hypothetical protein [Pedobacter duraquae]|uniref:Uncharacterized protein n=1 Tax=Pedobacter duraquae TaxID=425511 RepID=A0A4R6INZ5_9SPHI|nr:hypothetical protein [Pedobacter duraquae]TDO23963.1 hypothetical protein CLV32_0250 [Pedobacter duraquae]
MSTTEETFFQSMMAKSRVDMPYSDFEDRMMLRIHKEITFKKSLLKDLNLSILFFILGTGLGLLISTMLDVSGKTVAGISGPNMLIFFQLLFVAFVLMQSEKLIKLFIKSKKL